MMHYVYHLINASDPLPFTSTLSNLGNIRFFGSTGSTIPLGPRGINPLDAKNTVDNKTPPDLNNVVNYTLFQQGIFYDTSCSYIEKTELPYSWPPPTSNITIDKATVKVTVTCPGGSPNIRSVSLRYYNIIITDCPDEAIPGRATIWLNTFLYYDYPPTIDDWGGRVYGIGAMKCVVTPMYAEASVTYHATINAFTVSPVTAPEPLLGDTYFYHFTQAISNPPGSWWVIANWIEDLRTDTTGHLVGSLLGEIGGMYLGLPFSKRHEMYPPLVASMLKGMAEYYVRHHTQSRAGDERFTLNLL